MPLRSERRARVLLGLAIAAVVTTPTGTAHAEALSLEAVLRSVSEHSPNILSERADLAAARAEARAARGEFDPVLSAQARVAPLGYYDPRRADVVIEQPTPVLGASLYAGYRIGRGRIPPYYGEQRTLDRGEVRGGVRIPLLEGRAIDARRAGVRGSAADAEAAQASFGELLLELEQRAAKAYFGWVATGLKLRVTAFLVTLAEQRLGQLDELVERGALPPIEARDNQRAMLERKRQLVSARRALEQAALDLSLYLRGADGAPRVPGEHELPERLEAIDAAPSSVGAESRALAARPELDEYTARVERAEIDRELAANRVSPRLDAFGEVSRDFGSEDPSLYKTLAPTVVEVGATISMPLGLRRARGKLAAAEAKLESARQKARYAGDKVRTEVRDAHSQLAAARERVALAHEAAEAARDVASGERERFGLGASTVLFVNLREQQAADAESALIDALTEAHFAAVRARTVEGRSSFTSR